MYVPLLAAGVSTLAPLTDLHAPELHAAEMLDLSPESMERLADVCTRYTAGATSSAVRIAQMAVEASGLLFSPEILNPETRDTVRILVADKAERVRELEEFYLDQWAEGLGFLSKEQLAIALELRRKESVRLMNVLSGASAIWGSGLPA